MDSALASKRFSGPRSFLRRGLTREVDTRATRGDASSLAQSPGPVEVGKVSLPRIESVFSAWLARVDGFLARRWAQVLIFVAALVLSWLWRPGTAHAEGRPAVRSPASPGSEA